MIKLLTLLLLSFSSLYSVELISNFNFGLLPTNVDLNMNTEDYTFTIAMLGITSAFAFWIGWNSHT